MAKRYYWLKLPKDFFREKEIKKLRKIAGGDTYTIIYLKMMLFSMNTDGKLYYEGVEDSFAEEIALEIDEDIENVRVTMAYLLQKGLMQEVNPNEVALTRVPEMVGSETDKAALMRKSRARNLLTGNNVTENGNNVTEVLPTVTNCYTEREKEREIEVEVEKSESITPTPKEPKRKYGEYKHVLLKDSELEKLKNDFGLDMTDKSITFLDEYIEMKGYKAKSHYLAIRKWVIDAVKERQQKSSGQKQGRLDWLDNVELF